MGDDGIGPGHRFHHDVTDYAGDSTRCSIECGCSCSSCRRSSGITAAGLTDTAVAAVPEAAVVAVSEAAVPAVNATATAAAAASTYAAVLQPPYGEADAAAAVDDATPPDAADIPD